MNFYGQILYEFTKLFSKININNTGDKNINFPTATGEQANLSLDANTLWDECTFDSGNTWIQLRSDPVEKTVKIYHNEPDRQTESKVDANIQIVTQIPQEEQDKHKNDCTQLEAGQMISVRNGAFDDAGHFKGSNLMYLKMPQLMDGEIEVNDVKNRTEELEKYYFTLGANELLEDYKYQTPENEEENPEDNIDPINSEEMSEEEREDQLARQTLSKYGISLPYYLTKNEYLTRSTVKEAMANDFVTPEKIGNLNTVFPNTPVEEQSVAAAIGSFMTLVGNIPGKTPPASVCDAIGDISSVQDDNSNIAQILCGMRNQITALINEDTKTTNAFAGLAARVDALEKRLDALEAK